MCERERILRKIQIYGFAMYETALFLDSHCDSMEALASYNAYRDKKQQAIAEYEKSYGPLTIDSVRCGKWTWTDGPWPWEMED